MTKETIRKFKLINLATYPLAMILAYFMYPFFVAINKNIKYSFAWLFVAGIGIIILNHRFLSIVEKAKDTANFKDFLSTWGRKKIAENPDDYFTPEIYNQYRANFRYMTIYMCLAGIALFYVGFNFM